MIDTDPVSIPPELQASLPPHSYEYEQVVLGALILDARVAFPIVAEAIGEDVETFYVLTHQIIFRTIARMVSEGRPVEMVTLFEELRLAGSLDKVGGLTYIVKLTEMCHSPAGVGFFTDSLISYRKRRQTIALATELTAKAANAHDIEQVISKVTQDINGIAKSNRRNSEDIRTLIMNALGQIEESHKNQGRLPGIGTGFPDVDRMTSGLHNGDMIVIAARPSMGKTSLAMNIAEYVAVDLGLPVGVFSLEMTAEALTLRMLCSRARVNLRRIREGFLAERDFPKITGAAGKISRSGLHIDDSAGLSVFEMRARAHGMKDRHGIKLMVIDYLQLMRGTPRKNGNRESEVAEISNGLKSIAKELGIPVIVLSQLNRDMEREKNRRPRLSDLRESGAIEQDADLVAFLWKPSRDKDCDEDEGDAETVNLSIAKQRNGPTGDVALTFVKCYTRFESAAKVRQEDLPNYDVN